MRNPVCMKLTNVPLRKKDNDNNNNNLKLTYILRGGNSNSSSNNSPGLFMCPAGFLFVFPKRLSSAK